MNSTDNIVNIAEGIRRQIEERRLRNDPNSAPNQLIVDFAKLYTEEVRDMHLPVKEAIVIDISKHLAEFSPDFYDYILAKTQEFLKLLEAEVSKELGVKTSVHLKNICSKANTQNYPPIKIGRAHV